MTPEDKLKRLQEMIKLLDGSVTKEEFIQSFENVIKLVLEAEKKSLARIDDKLTGVIDRLRQQVGELDAETRASIEALKTEIRDVAKSMAEEQRKTINYVYDKVSKLKDGKDGKPGRDGRDGRDGKDGKDGLDGKDGKDGGGGGTSQIGVQQVLTKILKHQKFSTSSATTSSTLTHRVAGGVCIWLRYNGQMLHYGDQYTVSGTTITYTFTLDDSSVVEATYIAG